MWEKPIDINRPTTNERDFISRDSWYTPYTGIQIA
jgi:hypothetical protein